MWRGSSRVYSKPRCMARWGLPACLCLTACGATITIALGKEFDEESIVQVIQVGEYRWLQ